MYIYNLYTYSVYPTYISTNYLLNHMTRELSPEHSQLISGLYWVLCCRQARNKRCLRKNTYLGLSFVSFSRASHRQVSSSIPDDILWKYPIRSDKEGSDAVCIRFCLVQPRGTDGDRSGSRGQTLTSTASVS